jgi:hypothetical protein
VSGPLEPEFGWRPNPHKEKKVVKPVVPGREAVQISTKSEDMLVDLLKNIVRRLRLLLTQCECSYNVFGLLLFCVFLPDDYY